jgi:hypothetical protein
MAVSVSNTAYGIINDAMHDAGLLREGSAPNSEQLASYMRRLCDIINLWQTQGIKLFLLEEETITLVDGTNSYTVQTGTFPEKDLRIIQGRIVTPDGVYRTINSLSWQEWNTLPQVNEGAVTGYFVNKQATTLTVKVWNTPDATEALNSLVLLVQRQAANPINLETNVSFPQEWRIALRWGLADDICTGQPETIMNRCASRAKVYREALEDWDVEDTQTTFAPDMRGWGR